MGKGKKGKGARKQQRRPGSNTSSSQGGAPIDPWAEDSPEAEDDGSAVETAPLVVDVGMEVALVALRSEGMNGQRGRVEQVDETSTERLKVRLAAGGVKRIKRMNLAPIAEEEWATQELRKLYRRVMRKAPEISRQLSSVDQMDPEAMRFDMLIHGTVILALPTLISMSETMSIDSYAFLSSLSPPRSCCDNRAFTQDKGGAQLARIGMDHLRGDASHHPSRSRPGFAHRMWRAGAAHGGTRGFAY